jgi:3' terminal RNA ribose 2'-O-methyltransferase Hen1
MLLSITSRTPDSTDLGYLLHKNPANVHTTDLAYGKATVFFSKATPEETTAHLLVEVDPVGLVRGKGARQGGWALGQYVNDRPYAASSFLSTAISRCFGTAMGGRCEKRPELPGMPLDLTIRIPALPLAGDPDRVQSLFEPLGYEVEIVRPPLDPEFPSWGYARHGDVTLATRSPLALVLRHLFVLIPSLDSNKHYWIGSDEIEKLLAKGEGWLSDHPQREWITTRYLKFRRSLVSEALERLAPESDDEADDEEDIDEKSVPEAERALSLHEQRLDRVTELVKSINPETLVDLGCGGGKLLLRLLRKTKVPDILGVDVDSRSLEIASKRLRLETLPEKQRARVKLAQSALTYRDPRIEGRDVATLVEVIEHLEPDRLDSLERILFEHARPGTLIVTTPNREYNALFETLAEGKLRHPDHRFEWTRAEFQGWAERVSSENGYSFTIEPLGDEDETHGAPSQIAVFTRNPEQKP